MFEYMDDISEIVYVADLDTYELLYLNDSGKRMFAVDDIEGRTCYEALQRETAPCSMCTNRLLSANENYTWEYTNPVTGHRYLLKDRLIDWEGRAARLEVAFDMTTSEHDEAGLKNALDAESLILGCVRQLHSEHDPAHASEAMLERLGKSLSSDRAYIFEYGEGFLVNTYEWCAPGVEPEKDKLQHVDMSTVDRWGEYFDRGECVIIEGLDDEVDSSSSEHEILSMQDVTSLAVAPLEENGSVIGFIGIDNPPADKIRNIASLLKTLSYFYLVTMQRIENEQKLLQLSFRDELTGLYNRNRYMSDVERLKSCSGSLGVVFLDVNDLKLINDRFGHGRGDDVLRSCATMLSSLLKEADLYRIGGDEFVALLYDISREEFAETVASIEHAFDCDGFDDVRSVSVGSEWTDSANDVAAMLSAADANMYEKKRRFHLEKALAGKLPKGEARAPFTVSADGTALEESALLREYNMLMSALRVSVSKHLLNENFDVIWANDFFYEMTGYTREEYNALYHGSVGAYFAHDREEYRQLAEKVITAYESGKSGYECLVHMPQKGGNYLWIRVAGMFTDETVGGLPVIYATFTSVNEAVQMRKEQSITYDSLPGFVAKYRVTPRGLKLLYGNERFGAFFGYEAKLGVENELFQHNMALNAEVIDEHFEAMRAGDPVSFEIEARSVNDSKAYFTIIGNSIDRIDGDPVYLALYLDTTEIVEQRRLNEEANDKLRKLAFVDPVTGGRNRTRFEMDAGAAVAAAPANTYALVSIDVEKFKVINDLFGLEQGDLTLKFIHHRLAASLADDEYAGRISADLFNLLIKADDQEALKARIEGIVREVNEGIGFETSRSFVLTMTAGVYIIDDPTLPMMQIQDRANVARKKTSDAGTGQLCTCLFYSNDDRLRLAEEKNVENRMRTALEQGEFIIYLQPKFDLKHNAIEGAEALVRWNDPLRGLVPPNDFIPLFERNGFIVDLDLCVFKQVCDLLHDWLVAGERPVPISVNLSRAHLSDPDFLDRYEEIRDESGVPASFIEFELTETLVFENPKLLASIIDRIHLAGYSCSMDDFGSGYSSLNVLKDLEVDALKLDRAFFDGDELGESRGADVVDVVIELARRLRMKTIAEGVEAAEQQQYLTEAGCDMIQGYLFSRPITVEDFERLVFGHAVSRER